MSRALAVEVGGDDGAAGLEALLLLEVSNEEADDVVAEAGDRLELLLPLPAV